MVVGIADMKMAQYEGMLVTYALGSCIGICLYDPGLRLAALVHVMLPLNMETGRRSPMKYADTGIRETLRQMEARGARRSRMVAKIAGGARMFEVAGGGSLGNIGQRNIESVHMTLKRFLYQLSSFLERVCFPCFNFFCSQLLIFCQIGRASCRERVCKQV